MGQFTYELKIDHDEVLWFTHPVQIYERGRLLPSKVENKKGRQIHSFRITKGIRYRLVSETPIEKLLRKAKPANIIRGYVVATGRHGKFSINVDGKAEHFDTAKLHGLPSKVEIGNLIHIELDRSTAKIVNPEAEPSPSPPPLTKN